MARKLLIGALIVVVIGLVLLIYPDPQFRLIFSGGATGLANRGAFGNGTVFNRNFTGGGFNFTRGAGTGAARAAILGFNAASIIESIAGAGLVSVGVVLIAIEMFLDPSRIKVK